MDFRREFTTPSNGDSAETLKSSTDTTKSTTLPTTSSRHNHSHQKHRLWVMIVVTGLLMTEYVLQKLYYQHLEHQQQQRPDSEGRISLFRSTNNDIINVPKSQQFIAELELNTCRFPLFFDPSHVEFRIRDNLFVEPKNWRDLNKQLVGREDVVNVYHSLQRAAEFERQQRRQRRSKKEAELPRPRRYLTYVHVGKAGGSTVACNLRWGHRAIRQHCDNIDYDSILEHDGDNYELAMRLHQYGPDIPEANYIIPDSAISRHVNCYTHWRMHLKCYYLQGKDPFADVDFATETEHDWGRRRLSSSEEQGTEHHAQEQQHGNDHHHGHHQGHHDKTPKDPQQREQEEHNHHDKEKEPPEHNHQDKEKEPQEHTHQDKEKEPQEQNKEDEPQEHDQQDKEKEPQEQNQQDKEEEPLERQGDVLMKYKQVQERGNDFLVNMRSPIDRIASWFVYEHTENHELVYPDRDYHCGQLILSSCYKHFEHLTTVGLGYPRPPLSQPLRVGTNLSATECSHWAWAAVQGNMPSDYHNAFNYDWYAHRLLHEPLNQDADIFVLRVEHLEQDWSTVDKMLGGDGSFPETLAKPQNSADIKPLRVPNHNTTDVGILNLCKALCDEIQVYKQLLARAVNLEEEDLETSMEELRQQCPDEIDILPRVCRYD